VLRQIILLITWPQPASRKTVDSKHADVIKAFKIFNGLSPRCLSMKRDRRRFSANDDNAVG